MNASTVTMNESAIDGWSARNQRWLLERFALWRERLERQPGTAAPIPAPALDDPDGFQPAARQIQSLFSLTTFETELLVLAAGLEIDSSLRHAVAHVQNMTVRQPVPLTFSVSLALLADPHWDALAPQRPLRYWSLLDVDTSGGFAHAAARIDERIMHYLTGVAAEDERLVGVARFDDASTDARSATVTDDLAVSIGLALGAAPESLVMLPNAAAEAALKRAGRALARRAFERTGLRTLWVDIAAMPGDARELIEMARRIDREAALAGAGVALVLEGEAGASANAPRLIAALRSAIVTLGALSPAQLADCPNRRVLRFHVPREATSRVDGVPPDVERAAGRALQQFHVDTAALDQALASVTTMDHEEDVDDRVWGGLREAARGGLDALAQRLDSRATFEDLVVPASVAAQLREIVSQLRHRQQVYDEWGFGDRDRRGLGIAALFAGESGTGKTLAAEAIANAVRLDLYRIDLASIVSKYIGETEKNLSRLFDAAERSGAVLLFDEADALFGKRSEVKDSHDRYANIEVAYLLQ
jgi:hypothetical protein